MSDSDAAIAEADPLTTDQAAPAEEIGGQESVVDGLEQEIAEIKRQLDDVTAAKAELEGHLQTLVKDIRFRAEREAEAARQAERKDNLITALTNATNECYNLRHAVVRLQQENAELRKP